MRVAHSVEDLVACVGRHDRPAFVPTMGNLHQGHIALVRQAKSLGDLTVASIFVNRLQFLPHEDFDQYPRTWEADLAALQAAGCDVVFAPSESDLYPEPQTCKVQPSGEIADILEGEFRPGFFAGVCTVVAKLFACVQPRAAVFGKKDYQQLAVIRHMVRQLALPIEVAAGETQRAHDGLALSSRNGYLSESQRAQAPQLYRVLCEVAEHLERGNHQYRDLETDAMGQLKSSGWAPDYVSIRRSHDLRQPKPGDPVVVLAAARLGATRLIDNVEISQP
jgi:pantoate--beta-alanine ligase